MDLPMCIKLKQILPVQNNFNQKTMSKVIIDGVEYVPKGEEVKTKEWPQEGDDYYYVGSQGGVILNKWSNDDIDKERLACGNMFPTEQKAEYERLRRECMATRWVPEKGEEVFIYMPQCMLSGIRRRGEISSVEGVIGAFSVMVGLAAPNDEEAKARWDMYGEAWLDALEAKK